MKNNIRIVLYVLLTFSILALACSTLTPGGDSFAITQTALADTISNMAEEGKNYENTVIAQITAAGSDPMILTSIAYATQVAEGGAYNVTPPDFVASVIPPGFGSGNLPEDLVLMPDATDVQVLPGVVMFTTSSSKEDGYQFYLDQMPKLGWELDPNMNSSTQYAYTVRFTKSELRTAMVTVNIATGQTKVQIIHTGY